MSIASLDNNIPGPRATMHLPCAHVSTVPPHVPYDVSTEDTKPTIKKKRKRTDARQLEALNRVYARTPYPPTEERYQLASDLDMCPRRVQVWLVHTFAHITCMISELSIFSQVPEQKADDEKERTKCSPLSSQPSQ